jgi:hypothetical protein
MNMIIEHTPALPRPVGLLLVYPCMLVGLDFWISNSDLAVVEEEIVRGPIPLDSLKARPGRGDGMTLNSKAAFMDDQVLGSSFVSVFYTWTFLAIALFCCRGRLNCCLFFERLASCADGHVHWRRPNLGSQVQLPRLAYPYS